jgi:hypothetical protein
MAGYRTFIKAIYWGPPIRTQMRTTIETIFRRLMIFLLNFVRKAEKGFLAGIVSEFLL